MNMMKMNVMDRIVFVLFTFMDRYMIFLPIFADF